MPSQDLKPATENPPAKLDGPTQINVGLTTLAIAAALSLYFGGEDLRLLSAIVLMALPAVLIYLTRRDPQAYGFFKPKGDPRTDLRFAFAVCGFGLLLGTDVHFVETIKMIEFTTLIALLCCAGIFIFASRSREMGTAVFGVLCFASVYGWGAAATLDSLFDRSAPTHYTATVEDKYETYHRGTTYHLNLAPWGPVLEPDHLSVSGTVYGYAAIGQPVCIDLRLGLLRVQWYQLVPCADQAGQ